MKKKGFTLIELLAIIVILAIIAVITVPIILNIIENSRKGAAIDSAYGYKDAISKYYITELAKNPSYNELNGTYTVNEDGSITDGSKEYSIPVSGTIPSGGKIKLKNNGINEACLIINGYEITYSEGKFETNGKGDCEGMVGDQPVETTCDESTAVKFDNDTNWSEIIEAVKNGQTCGMQVGNTKTVNLGDELGTHTLRIANTTTPEDCKKEGFSQTACGFVLEFADIITTHRMNPYDLSKTEDGNGNKGGWKESEMRKYLNCTANGSGAFKSVVEKSNNDGPSCENISDETTLYDALPQELKDAIIDTTVVSGHGSSDSENFTTTDKIYLLATAEIWENGSSNQIKYDTARNNTRQLDYYAQEQPTTTDSFSRAIKNYNGEATKWWLRSANSDISNNFFYVNGFGNWDRNLSHFTYGVAPAFRIGPK